MNRTIPVFLAAICFLALSVLFSLISIRAFSYPYPEIKISPESRFAAIDMSGVLLGARRMAADAAWIELLQYYGSPETPLDKDTEFRLSWDMTKYLFGIPLEKHKSGSEEDEHHYHPDFGGVYQGLYLHCVNVTKLDPYFSYAYLYGAGALAWNLNRPDEAIKLLESGISSVESFRPDITKDVHQPFWQYHLYLSAIIYSKSGKYNEMTSLLDTAAKQPQCPNMVKAILANIYQKNNKPGNALKLWVEIFNSNDPTYAKRALSKISELNIHGGV